MNVNPNPKYPNVTSLSLESANLRYGNKSYRVWYLLKNAKGNTLKRAMFTLSEEQYDGWGADDSYVENIIAKSLNFTIA